MALLESLTGEQENNSAKADPYATAILAAQEAVPGLNTPLQAWRFLRDVQ